ALRKLIDKKAKAKDGKRILEEVDEPAGAAGGNVIDLMAALKKSVAAEKGGAKPKAKPAASKKKTA
ncbi:MAG: Ku protein, partial [Alphaproteobacteria bacterium]|nr:Ku protein [Alphaproteobacteria bacterium]